MTLSRALLLLALALPTFAVGCAADTSEDDESVGDEDVGIDDDALTGTARVGARFATTTRLNFREGPSRREPVKRVLASGAVVTLVKASPQNGYYQVTNGGAEGWVFGTYLRPEDAAPGNAGERAPAGTGTGQIESCKASFYSEGQRTANGESFDPNALTAAHKRLPFGTRVRVTNTANGRTVTVRINDRGPFVAGRCIDLSRAAFTAIASASQGVASVTVEVLR